MLLRDKVVLVSGIGPGMGESIARACAREGARLVLAARTQKAVEELAASLRATDRQAIGVPTDVADEAQSHALVEAAIARFGRIDVLVNNAFR